ncbi:hypothetical protein F66182_2083 [Fusarium sp. NRRL 66182]|nr:hypothetical protein F66182_2083 [Fusarium sp. NRRL 66182]
MANGTVTKIRRQQNGPWFSVSVDYHHKPKKVEMARNVILATGIKDILPDTPGIRENWGKGIYWCPWCDGHEHADQPLGLLGPLHKLAGMVRDMRTLNTDVVAFINGTDNNTMRNLADKEYPGWEEYLEQHNVTIEKRTITRIERVIKDSDEESKRRYKRGSKDNECGDKCSNRPSVPEFDLFDVHFSQGTPIRRAAFLAIFPTRQTSNIGAEAGVILVGGNPRLSIDNHTMMTNVPGIYAVGDASSYGATSIPFAMFSGKRAAISVHSSTLP